MGIRKLQARGLTVSRIIAPCPPCPAVLCSALPHPAPPHPALPAQPRLANLQRASSAEMTPAPSPNSVELASWIASASLAKVRADSTGPKIWNQGQGLKSMVLQAHFRRAQGSESKQPPERCQQLAGRQHEGHT